MPLPEQHFRALDEKPIRTYDETRQTFLDCHAPCPPAPTTKGGNRRSIWRAPSLFERWPGQWAGGLCADTATGS
jgi:hypothetical protein